MTLIKSAAVAAIVAAAALGSAMGAAEAGKKHHHGFHHHHNHHKFHKRFYGPTIVIGSADYGCKHWLRRYKKTGKKDFLNRYYACLY